MKKVFIITGEYSGEVHASKVVEELRKIYPDVEIEGVGGKVMEDAGVKLFLTHEKMSAMGFSYKIIKDHLNMGKKIVDYLKNDYKPDLLLLIDYGAFNLNIAKALKKRDFKIFYYIPPQVWASRKWRINVIKKHIDKVLCIFPFEKTMYESYGINVHYCGHPLIAQLPPKVNREEFFKKHNLDLNKKLVSVFPGSRVFELQNLMSLFVLTAKTLKKMHPDLQFLISQAPNISDEVYKKYFKDNEFIVVKGENHALLSVSDSLILASGTVALEATLYQTPMIIAYKGPWLFFVIYLVVRCLDKVSLPNIIADKFIVPEMIQSKAKYDKIAYEIEKTLYDAEYRENFVNELGKVGSLLAEKNSAFEVANQIKEALL